MKTIKKVLLILLLALPLAAVIYAAARSAARHKRQLSKSAADTENEVPLL